MPSSEEVLRRSERAFSRKAQWRRLYEDCYTYALPQRNLYYGGYEFGADGQSKTARVFDSTAINSTQRFANRIQSALFPPYRRWCHLRPGHDVPGESHDEVAASLDLITEQMFTLLRQTNFDLAISEFLLDLCVGTAVMLVMPGDEDTPIRFQAVPQYLVSIEEGPHGTVDNVYRKVRVRADTIVRQWPDAVLPDRIQHQIEDKPDSDLMLLEATLWSQDDGAYTYHVIYSEDRTELVHRLMPVSPWVVARYTKVAGEVYGRGPLVSALPDIKTLNKVKELLLKNASLAVTGVYTAADDGVLNPNNISIVPGAIIPVARNGGPQGESLRPLRAAGDFNITQLIINDLIVSVKKTLLDDTLPPETQSARSATEIAERMKELSQNLGSAYGRLIIECMMPIVDRILHALSERDHIHLPLRADGKVVKVVPVSPLARAQDMEDLDSVLQFLSLAERGGVAAQVAVNQDEAIDYIADKLSVPDSVLNSREQREAILAEMQAIAAAQQQQQPEG